MPKMQRILTGSLSLFFSLWLSFGTSVSFVTSYAQQPQPQQATPPPTQKPSDPANANGQDIVRISTQLVQVDAVVTDKNGKHIEDLTENEFELMVDGKRQSLSHFSRITLPPVERAPAPKKKTDAPPPPESMPTRQLAKEEVRRTVAFVVDDLGLTISSTEMVRETLRRFVAEQMQEGDLVAIIRTGNGLGMLEQFTSDKRLLYAAIERLIWNPLSRDMSPTFADSGAEVSDDASARQDVLADFEEFRETNFTTGTLGAVQFVVNSLRALPGRKSVILLSDGFRINSPNDNDGSTNRVLQNLKQLVELANRSSVVVYAIDAKGLQPFMPGANVGGRPGASAYTDAQQSAQEALEGPTFLAQQTGGFIVTNTNDLNIGVAEALYDQQSYYLLGFDPDDAKFDRRYHSIKLRVTRPGVKVRTRNGFFGVTEGEERGKPAEAPKTRGEQILSALLAPLATRELTLKMTPYFFNSSKEGPLVRALFQVDCSKLTFKDGPNNQKLLNLDLAAFAFDETGAPADFAARRLALTFNEQQYQQVLAHGLPYRADFPLKRPGAYQFRALLRDDATGYTGAVSQFIRVPDLSKNQLAVSGLVLTAPKAVAAPAVEAEAAVTTSSAVTSEAAGQAVGEAVKAELKAEPAGAAEALANPYVRVFPRTGWIQYGAGIYNATPDKKTGKPQITVQAELYRGGKPAYKLSPQTLDYGAQPNAKRFEYAGRLRLNNLPSGEYLLHLVVTDALAKKKTARAEQWIDFTVR